MSKAKSGGGTNSKVVRNVGVKGGAPTTRKVNVDVASNIGRSVGTHVMGNGGGEVQRPNQPMYKPVSQVPLGNAVAQNVGSGGPGKGYVNHGPGGSQGQHGAANPGHSPQPRDILSEFGPEGRK